MYGGEALFNQSVIASTAIHSGLSGQLFSTVKTKNIIHIKILVAL